LNEEEIINGCIHKNTACQQLLFDKYAGSLLSICRRYARDPADAEDILQEAFIKIFANIGQYRFAGSFEGWIKKITVNYCLKYLQKKRIEFKDSTETEAKQNKSIEPEILSSLSEEELIKMISNLPDGYRLVFNLYVIEGYDHNEIAGMLNIKATTSRSQLIKARRLLQKQILLNQNIASNYDR
jgi:RNA polymerase sigma-70 factor (ECF subfamily)